MSFQKTKDHQNFLIATISLRQFCPKIERSVFLLVRPQAKNRRVPPTKKGLDKKVKVFNLLPHTRKPIIKDYRFFLGVLKKSTGFENRFKNGLIFTIFASEASYV